MSKYADAQYRLYQRLESKVYSRFSFVVHFGKTFEYYLRTISISEFPEERKKLSMYYKGKLTGVGECLFKKLQEELLHTVHVGPDGRIWRPKDDSWLNEPHEYKSKLLCMGVWKSFWDKGVFKPFICADDYGEKREERYRLPKVVHWNGTAYDLESIVEKDCESMKKQG